MKIVKFEDLECWQDSRVLVRKIYQLTRLKLFSLDYGLRDQVQRASVSVMSNIAEGFDCYSNKEFVRFLGYSTRSCSELRSQMYVALDIEYITQEQFNEVNEQLMKCTGKIKGLIKYLNKN